MTQSITSCAITPVGKTYPVEHLRTAESIEQLFKYVDAGHPIADNVGCQARLLRYMGDLRNIIGVFEYDAFLEKSNVWIGQSNRVNYLLYYIKLAPIAYKDGRPLHVGDKIEVESFGELKNIKATVQNCVYLARNSDGWRFADQLEAL